MEQIFSFFAESFDLPILEWIAANLYCGFLNAVMPVITVLGNAGIFWIALAVVLIFIPKTRKIGISMGAALLIGLVVCNLTLKPLMARMRPYDYQLTHFGKTISLLIATPHDYSFPSGHTLASFEGAMVLFLYNKKWSIPALILASLIAFSRLYLYVHYPTDVLFSVVLSVGIALLAKWAVEKAFSLLKKE
jgi:undecaprenyl-diphosphatase